jgi:hypothetical protein
LQALHRAKGKTYMQRLKAIAEGKLFGAVDCYVLEDGTRVLSKRGMVHMLSAGTKAGESIDSGDLGSEHKPSNLGQYLKRLPSRFAGLAVSTNVEFILPGGRVGHGIDTKTVTAICRAYVEAQLAGELRESQRHLAQHAMELLSASADVGVAALVDEATGYEKVRPDGDMAKIFRDAMGVWQEAFSPELVRYLCRLGIAGEKNATWTSGSCPRPLAQAFRQIYDLILGKQAARELKKRNPEPRYGSNHHQWLTDEARALLKQNMGVVLCCARTSNSRAEFWQRLKDFYRGQDCLVLA